MSCESQLCCSAILLKFRVQDGSPAEKQEVYGLEFLPSGLLRSDSQPLVSPCRPPTSVPSRIHKVQLMTPSVYKSVEPKGYPPPGLKSHPLVRKVQRTLKGARRRDWSQRDTLPRFARKLCCCCRCTVAISKLAKTCDQCCIHLSRVTRCGVYTDCS